MSRLIDADALLEHVWRDRLDSRERIANLVEFMPTIEERKTGEWITHYYKLGTERYECNVCHNRIGDTPYYCPNCGADMRGD